MAKYDEHGREIPDSTKPAGMMWPRPLTLQEEMRRFIRTEMSRDAADHGMETFEEADDFNVEDDEDLSDNLSPHEMTLMQEEAVLPDASNLEVTNDEDQRGRPDAPASPVRDGAPALRETRSPDQRDSQAPRASDDVEDPNGAGDAEQPSPQLVPQRQSRNRRDRKP